MSTMLHDFIRLPCALDQTSHAISPAVAALMVDAPTPNYEAASGGYAFEAALCFAESQSPLLRSVLDDPAATIKNHESYVLLNRVRLLANLLASMRGQLDAEDLCMLLDAAGRVTEELAAALIRVVASVSINSLQDRTERDSASAALAEARLLAEGIGVLAVPLRKAQRPTERALEQVH
jgi:hypothetical protein